MTCLLQPPTISCPNKHDRNHNASIIRSNESGSILAIS